MSAYNKLRSVIGNLKTLTEQKQGVAEDVNPFNSLAQSKIHFRKNGFEQKYERTTSTSAQGGKKIFQISNSNGWVSSLSFSTFMPREDENGFEIYYKRCAILNLIKSVRIRIGNVEVQKYDAYGIFNLLAHSNNLDIRDQLLILTSGTNQNGNLVANEDMYEFNIPLPSVGTKMNYNGAPEDYIKKLPFPIGKCSGDLIVEIEMNPISDAVEGIEGGGAFAPPASYGDLRVNYENWVLAGEGGAVVDEKSSDESGEYVYQTYALETLGPDDITLSDTADTKVKIEDLRKDGELLTVMVSPIPDSYVADDKFRNGELIKLQFSLGNDLVFDADSRRSSPVQLLNILRHNTGYSTGLNTDFMGDLYQCPLSADPMNWQSSVYYGANPDKKSMTLTMRSSATDAGNFNLSVLAFYRSHIRILPNGNVIQEYVPSV